MYIVQHLTLSENLEKKVQADNSVKKSDCSHPRALTANPATAQKKSFFPLRRHHKGQRLRLGK